MTTTNVCAAAASSPTNNSLVGEGDEAMRRVQLHSPRHADATRIRPIWSCFGPSSTIYQRWVPWILCKLQMVCNVAARAATASLSIVDDGNSDRVESEGVDVHRMKIRAG